MNWLVCLKWDPCELQERREKGIFRAAHPHTPFLGQCPPLEWPIIVDILNTPNILQLNFSDNKSEYCRKSFNLLQCLTHLCILLACLPPSLPILGMLLRSSVCPFVRPSIRLFDPLTPTMHTSPTNQPTNQQQPYATAGPTAAATDISKMWPHNQIAQPHQQQAQFQQYQSPNKVSYCVSVWAMSSCYLITVGYFFYDSITCGCFYFNSPCLYIDKQ